MVFNKTELTTLTVLINWQNKIMARFDGLKLNFSVFVNYLWMKNQQFFVFITVSHLQIIM